MFFKKNGNSRRRVTPPPRELSPKFERLVRESWLLLVAVGIVYVVLILATFNRAEPGWSQSGEAGRHPTNAGGPFGAWLADLHRELAA